jgi:hypothetical protein
MKLRILDFDIENRPLSYWIPDRPSAEVTAIAWKFVNERSRVQCRLLYPLDDAVARIVMLYSFVNAYNEADLVMGHYIRRHDLPILNGALLELGMPSLSEKMTIDTKLDLLREKDMPVSQENLAAMLGVKSPKIHMTQSDWRDANRLTPTGLKKTERRVTADVRQNIEMYFRLLELGWLTKPKMWRP